MMLLMFFFCLSGSSREVLLVSRLQKNPVVPPLRDVSGPSMTTTFIRSAARPRLDAGKFPPVLCDFVAQCLRRDDTKCLVGLNKNHHKDGLRVGNLEDYIPPKIKITPSSAGFPKRKLI